MSDADRVTLPRSIEEPYTFSNLINRTRRRDIGEFTVRKPETLTAEFTAGQREVHDTLLDIVARILAFCHGDQNVKFMMTTIRRQAASCLYGLVPLFSNREPPGPFPARPAAFLDQVPVRDERGGVRPLVRISSTTSPAHPRPVRPPRKLNRRSLSIELDRSIIALSSIRFREGRRTNIICETIEHFDRSDAPYLKSGPKQPALFGD